VPVGAGSLWSQLQVLVHPGIGITWVGIVTWVFAITGVVEGEEEERKRIKEAECKSCSKSV